MAQYPDNWITLPAATVFKVQGADATPYLQSQVSQNLPSALDSGCVYTLWLNERGRVEADSYVLRQDAEHTTLVSFHTPPAVLRHCIERHIIADDVDVEPVESPRSFLAIPGSEGNQEQLQAAGFTLPEKGGLSFHPEGRVLFREERGAPPLYILESPEADAAGEPDGWTRERILRKIPAVPAEVGARDTPFDLDLLEPAVSLTKGCFLGQEVLARLRAQGRSVRRLGILRGTGKVPTPGEAILHNARSVGRLLVAVEDSEGWLGLAQVRRNLEDGNAEALQLENGQEISPWQF